MNFEPKRTMMTKAFRTHLSLAATAAVVTLGAPLEAQQTQIGGDLRVRFETRDVEGTPAASFTGMRTRIDLARALSSDARVFFQLQDVRLWGDEISTTDASADLLDMHQAYLELGHRGESPLWLRIGRQEDEYAEGRLIGMPVWSNVGRSYDGVKATVPLGDGGMIDLFGYQVGEASSPNHTNDDVLMGAWATLPIDAADVQLFGIWDRAGETGGTRRYTYGTYVRGETGILDWRVEGALQSGDLQGVELSANMFAARVTAPLLEGRGDLTLWYDRYSGDAEAQARDGLPTGAFSDLFGRNHRFFGFADLFARIPTDTQGRGLQDLAIRANWDVLDEGTLSLDLHRFVFSDDTGLADGTIADEVDVYLTTPAGTGLSILAGVSWVGSRDGGEVTGVVDRNQWFGYLQLQATF